MCFLIFSHYKARHGKTVTIKRYMKAGTVQNRIHIKNVLKGNLSIYYMSYPLIGDMYTEERSVVSIDRVNA